MTKSGRRREVPLNAESYDAPERLRSAVTRLEGLTSNKPAEESAPASTQDACSPEGVLPNSAQ